MDADEREIYYYLKPYRNEYLSGREIARRAGGKRRFREDPQWAVPALLRMVERDILETDPAGHYRIKPAPEKTGKKKWVSPQVARILKASGKQFEGVIEIDEAELDNYYDNL
ncbi:MAG: hypothetical protein EPO07_13160 [Verrucomicrobia bacterium]|nr:MAG: hypothetical protein EPO07_13160 [Verrucomicrobiota bacterium]